MTDPDAIAGRSVRLRARPCVGIVMNPFSDGNRGAAKIAEFAAAHETEMAFAAPPSVAALPETLANFARRGVSILGVDGGDGTVRDVLSALPQAYGEDTQGDAWPAIAILASGKTNLIARDVGTFGRGTDGARRLLQASQTPERMATSLRPCLEASWGNTTVRGLFAGAGAFTYATRAAGIKTFRRGIKQNLGVALTMAQVVQRYFDKKPNRMGANMAFDAEGGIPPAPTPHFLFLATTLNRLMLGFWPFPGARTDTNMLHWLALSAPPNHFGRLLWQAWKGTLAAHTDSGVFGGNTTALAVRFGAPFVMDGERFNPTGEIVTLRAGKSVRFLTAKTWG